MAQQHEPPTKHIEGLSGWGRYPVAPAEIVRPERFSGLVPSGESITPRGLGRSYGDAALNSAGRVLLTERLNRLLEFDETTGLLRAEAGVTLADILDVFVPRGWFLPVTPGTKFCTLGGCVAADVHGKNHHHDGCFSAHVAGITLTLADGRRVYCSKDVERGLFWATVGGMGLTGIIGEVDLRLIRIETAWMALRHTRARNLQEMVSLLDDPALDDAYVVAWIDCLQQGSRLGRGVVMAGHHAGSGEVPLDWNAPLDARKPRVKKFPIDLPGWALNPVSIRAFNAIYDWAQGRKGSFLSPYERFFYPLDAILDWNRMYGKRGFVQYQFVLPTESAEVGMRLAIERLSSSGNASFLAVLKRFGPQGPGLLSFPRAGLTLALDIPLRQGLLQFLDEMDRIVIDHGGRVYLAKDARLSAANFRAMYPRWEEFLAAKSEVDPEGRFTSDLARRLELAS